MVWRCFSLKLANCVKRYLALLFDFSIIGIIDFIILVIIVMFIKIANIQTFNTELKFIIHYLFPPLCGFILPMLYFVFLETKYNATFGKIILKIGKWRKNQRIKSIYPLFVILNNWCYCYRLYFLLRGS